jgi:hypothetical protein
VEAAEALELRVQIVTACRRCCRCCCGRGLRRSLLGLHGGHLLLQLGCLRLRLEGGLLRGLLISRGLSLGVLAAVHPADDRGGRAGDDGGTRHRAHQSGSSDPSPHHV